jgi:hypothetical protein
MPFCVGFEWPRSIAARKTPVARVEVGTQKRITHNSSTLPQPTFIPRPRRPYLNAYDGHPISTKAYLPSQVLSWQHGYRARRPLPSVGRALIYHTHSEPRRLGRKTAKATSSSSRSSSSSSSSSTLTVRTANILVKRQKTNCDKTKLRPNETERFLFILDEVLSEFKCLLFCALSSCCYHIS